MPCAVGAENHPRETSHSVKSNDRKCGPVAVAYSRSPAIDDHEAQGPTRGFCCKIEAKIGGGINGGAWECCKVFCCGCHVLLEKVITPWRIGQANGWQKRHRGTTWAAIRPWLLGAGDYPKRLDAGSNEPVNLYLRDFASTFNLTNVTDR